ncbi:MAG: ATP-grasp fold amidoligase family protein [Bacteroidia bacterium]|nr:ATP-grasp fold amidoligase family protein [Bacteroidia bacterium]
MNLFIRIDQFLQRKWKEKSPKIKSDVFYIKVLYFLRMHKVLHLKNPKTFSEKLQWLKLYAYKPEYTTMVDKYLAKDYVKNIIGEQYIIPTLGAWNKAEDIDFDSLPVQFVLKTNHDCGGLVICKDKTQFDKQKAINKLNQHLQYDYFWPGRDKPYKYVERKIFAEAYMEDTKTAELRDYKFFCFDGVVKFMFVASDRQKRQEPYFDFFDENYNHLPVRQGHPNAPGLPEKPVCFELMKSLASKLSKGIPQVRVDFYEVDGKVFFGELTFYHFAGMTPFHPAKWDRTFGDMIKLPSEKAV